MITIENKGCYCEVVLQGKLSHADYEAFIPEMEAVIQQTAEVRVLADLRSLTGWEPQALWDDFKFGMQHRHDFHKMAIVGDKKWQEYASQLGALLMRGELRYFPADDHHGAVAWLAPDADEAN